jgi:hypothetical protein
MMFWYRPLAESTNAIFPETFTFFFKGFFNFTLDSSILECLQSKKPTRLQGSVADYFLVHAVSINDLFHFEKWKTRQRK